MFKLGAWLAVLLSALVSMPAAIAQQRTITLVVSQAPGGGVDTIGRLMAEKLSDRLKQPVVVENRTGAGGMLGADAVAKSAPDGNTLFVMENASVLHKWLHKSVPYDVAQDFAPIALVATSPLLLFAHPSMPANDAKDVIAQARASPGKLSVGIPGIGSPHHLAMLMMNAAAKIDITPVYYRGTAPALNDLVGGQIPMIWATPIVVMPQVAAGKVKALGVASLHRAPILADVPTIAENALPGFNVDIWFGIAAPGKTPREIVQRLATAMREVTELPEVQSRMQGLGFALDYRGSDDFRKLVLGDHERFGKIIRDAGIEPN